MEVFPIQNVQRCPLLLNSLMFHQSPVQMFGHVYHASGARFGLKSLWFPKVRSSASNPQSLAAEEQRSSQDGLRRGSALAERRSVGLTACPWPWPHTVTTPQETSVTSPQSSVPDKPSSLWLL